MLASVYRDEWGTDALCASQLLQETQEIFSKAIDKGTPQSTSHRTAFKQRLKASTDVFSAFRVHRCAQDVAAELTDEQGNRRSFGEWAERVQPYLNHQNRAWLQTEYATAVRRAHDEADWLRFKEDADLYPNLEWVPSTSATPGADHQIFWGTVLPIGDEFWTEHRPGDRWNCKCSLRQTNKPVTTTPRVSGHQYDPAPGLSAAPGSGEVFSEDHVYYPEGCSFCVFASGLRGLMANLSSKAKPFSKDGTCMGCSLRKRCMEKEAEAEQKDRVKAEQTARKAVMDWAAKSLDEVTLYTTTKGEQVQAQRKVVIMDKSKVIINKKGLREICNKGRHDADYSLRMSLIPQIESHANAFSFVRYEEPRHHNDTTRFKVLEGEIDGHRIEIKLKCNDDGEILYALRIL